MITYKYKLYKTERTKHLDKMLREASFVWNHALSLQKRYYSLYGGYISVNKMQKHFSARLKPKLLHSQSVQEILQRLDTSYQRFFKKISTRPPKFKRAKDFTSFVFKQGGYTLNGNVLTINKLHKRYKFSKSRDYEGKIKRIAVKRSKLNEYYVIITTDNNPNTYEKTHNGASVGIDFGLKTYLTMSDGDSFNNPQFLKEDLTKLRRKSRLLSKTKKKSNNREKRRIELCRLHESIQNKRNDYQWKLAHELCRKYDYIFIEDLSLTGMTKLWGRKMNDLSHASFISKLQYVATKYGVKVHKIDRWFASSKTCECGYVNNSLTLSDREWKCPECGLINDRDVLAANNILRRGISELWSEDKTAWAAHHVCTQESPCL